MSHVIFRVMRPRGLTGGYTEDGGDTSVPEVGNHVEDLMARIPGDMTASGQLQWEEEKEQLAT